MQNLVKLVDVTSRKENSYTAGDRRTGGKMGAARGHPDTRQVELLERKATQIASETVDEKR